MGRNTQGVQDAVQAERHYYVKYDVDNNLVRKVSKACGANSLKNASSWLHFIKFRAKERFWAVSVDDVAFLFGSFSRNHFRLAELAVEKNNQRKGYGRFMLSLLFEECLKRNIYSVTFRTSMDEDAYLWYQRLGAKITGTKQNDYEMRFNI